jgi:hypothetical protein
MLLKEIDEELLRVGPQNADILIPIFGNMFRPQSRNLLSHEFGYLDSDFHSKHEISGEYRRQCEEQTAEAAAYVGKCDLFVRVGGVMYRPIHCGGVYWTTSKCASRMCITIQERGPKERLRALVADNTFSAVSNESLTDRPEALMSDRRRPALVSGLSSEQSLHVPKDSQLPFPSVSSTWQTHEPSIDRLSDDRAISIPTHIYCRSRSGNNPTFNFPDRRPSEADLH